MYIYRQKNATMAVAMRAPTEPTETRAEPPVDGAEVVAGGEVALAELELAGTLLLLGAEVAYELETGALLLGAEPEGAGAVVAGADGAGAEGAGAEGEPPGVVAGVVAGGAGALPGGVTWI